MNIDEITQGIYRDWGDQLAKKKIQGGKIQWRMLWKISEGGMTKLGRGWCVETRKSMLMREWLMVPNTMFK